MASSTGSKNQKQKRSAKTWKRAGAEEVSLPSDNVCLAKRPGPAALMQEGVLPDTLMPIVQESIRSKKGLPPEKVDELAKDPKALASMLDAMDRMMPLIVIEPKVLYHRREIIDPITGDPRVDGSGKTAFEVIPFLERDEEILYTDDIDLEDKSFLFQFAVGGTRDYERFRRERDSALGGVDAIESVPGPA